MKKTEIIQSIAYAMVPSGAKLVQRDTGLGFSMARVGQGDDAGGLQIMAAKMFEEQLEIDTSWFGEKPDAKLFEHLHKVSMEFYGHMVAGASFEVAEEAMIEDYRKIIERLRQIAKELGINYHEPDDPLLK